MDHNSKPLGKQGRRGALLKITLTSHNYTYVTKGTVKAFFVNLLHEAHVYDRLQLLQGSAVPVNLGTVDLHGAYFLDPGMKIVHIMFMAWVGFSLQEQTPSVPSEVLTREKSRSMGDVSNQGVVHGDLHHLNMLWDESGERVMLIDFEGTLYRMRKRSWEARRTPPIKKRRTHDGAEHIEQSKLISLVA